MKIGPVGLALIKDWEGFRAQAYQDSVGVWTIGYGTTAGAGVNVHKGMTCTVEQAAQWLEEYVNRSIIPAIQAAQQVRLRVLGSHHALNENQVDALCDLGYNCGAGLFGGEHTIGANIREGASWLAVANAILLYNQAGGHVLEGLVRRREAERELFLRPVKR